jgi:hypothetical protein
MREGMKACATILRHAAAVKAGTPMPEQRDDLEQASSTLQKAVDILDGDGHRRAIRVLFLMSLRRAYDKDLLARPKDAAEVQRRLVKVEEIAPEETRLQSLVQDPPAPIR